jgi:ADP-ribosyl-[dinitrogen reductase] hydrolase
MTPMNTRTSISHPLHIATLDLPTGGRIGLTFCPGKCDASAMTGAWSRDLEVDLRAIVDWGASTLVTLIETHEFHALGVPNLGVSAQAQGLVWHHLPIRDVSVPDASFENAWQAIGPDLRQRLHRGEGLVVHCRGGLGRAGTVAARLLVELGEAPARALSRVRAVRPGAVETQEQERYVLGCRASSPLEE